MGGGGYETGVIPSKSERGVVFVIGSTFSFLAANFTNVARLNIARDKGWFVMDDLSFNRGEGQGTVLEPGSIVLLGVGAAALGWARRRRERA